MVFVRQGLLARMPLGLGAVLHGIRVCDAEPLGPSAVANSLRSRCPSAWAGADHGRPDFLALTT